MNIVYEHLPKFQVKAIVKLLIMATIKLEPSWKIYLVKEFEKDYMKNLKSFLIEQKQKGKIIYPHGDDIFNAFNLTPFDQVKVVIIGQDPYHGENQAHGLCFSVKKGVPIPPSLVNIFKELQDDQGVKIPPHGHLEHWAESGVLLLNSVLTVEKGKAGSHHGRGWEEFTDKVIEILNEKKENLVFILWGSPAQKKAQFVDNKKHLVIKAPHPSPLSAYRGFFGSKPFSKTNNYLIKKGISPIDWQLK
jgi:uracil-DNA glycosylase